MKKIIIYLGVCFLFQCQSSSLQLEKKIVMINFETNKNDIFNSDELQVLSSLQNRIYTSNCKTNEVRSILLELKKSNEISDEIKFIYDLNFFSFLESKDDSAEIISRKNNFEKFMNIYMNDYFDVLYKGVGFGTMVSYELFLFKNHNFKLITKNSFGYSMDNGNWTKKGNQLLLFDPNNILYLELLLSCNGYPRDSIKKADNELGRYIKSTLINSYLCKIKEK